MLIVVVIVKEMVMVMVVVNVIVKAMVEWLRSFDLCANTSIPPFTS